MKGREIGGEVRRVIRKVRKEQVPSFIVYY